MSLHTDDVVLIDAPQGASVDNSVTRSSQVRTHDIKGISSIRPVDRSFTGGIRQIVLVDRDRGQSYQSGGVQQPRTSTINRRDSSDGSNSNGFRRERGRPPERERYPSRGRPPDRGGPSNGGGSSDDRRPPR